MHLHGYFIVLVYEYMEKNHTANTRINDELNEKLEAVIEKGGIQSRSEAIRFSIHITHLLMVADKYERGEKIKEAINKYLNLEQ